MTYAEENENKPFDWNKFLSTNHGEKAWEKAYNLAGSWITCACGNTCSIIPRDPFGEPTDKLLAKYGLRFAENIDNRDRTGAQETLAKIEHRSKLLIKKILSKNGQTSQEKQSA